MKKTITLFLSLGILIPALYAQLTPEPCHFDHVLTEKLNESPANLTAFHQMNAKITEVINFNNSTKAPGDIYVIPVVVHVIHLGEPVGTGTNISDAQINSAIDNLTDTYRNAFGNSIDNNIEFQLAIRDENCNTTTGIVRVDGSGVPGYLADGVNGGTAGADENTLKDLSKWNTDQYMNFWIVSEIDGNNGGAGVQGWANLPFPGYDAYDGSVMMASSFGYDPLNLQPTWPLNFGRDNSTPIHEVGHFLSLYHTFHGDGGGGACPGNVTVGTDSDGCADTPPHMRNSSTCPVNGTNNPCAAGTLDEVKLNYMDYSSCPEKFTSDQKDRMRATLEDPTLRGGLITSLALTPITIPFVDPIVASCTPTTQATGLGSFFAGVGTTSFKQINISTGYANQDNGYLSPSCSGVAYVESSEVVPLSVSVLGSNTSNLKVYIDYNNDGDFDDAGELVHTANSLGGDATTTTNVTIPATGGAVLNTHLRMRVIHDLNTIPNACHNPEYSQAEDFSVYITDPVAAAPVAEFSADNLAPCVDEEVTFDDLSTNTPTSWLWEITPATGWTFTGGTNSNSEDPKTTFTTAGTYTVKLTATNASGTDDEIKTTYITVHDAPTATLTATNTTCGMDNGQIVAVITGNTAAPTYAWASGSTTDTQTGLAAGNETVTITVDGCTINENETVIADPAPTLTLAITQATCGLTNGEVVATLTGNVGVPTYAWASGSTTDTQTGLDVGDEILTVTVDGCTLTETAAITNAAPAVTLTPTQPTCGLNNGEIVAVVTGNIAPPTFAWGSGSTTDTQTGLGAGNETLIITVDGCTINEDETLTAAATPTVTITATNTTCGMANGELVAIVTGNIAPPTFAWASGSTTDTQTGLNAGNETVIVSVDGCDLTANETVIANPAPTITLTPTQPTCGLDNGQIVATITGNIAAPTYAWASGSTTDTQTGLSIGTESVVVDVDGCSITVNETLVASPLPTVALTITNATCGINNGQIVAAVSGNTAAPTFAWASGSTTDTQTGLGAGNETLVVMVDGCTLNESATLTAAATPIVTLTAVNASCGLNNGQISASITGNAGVPNYAWASGSTSSVQTGLGAGNETLTVTVDGCTINANETLTTTEAPNAGNLDGLSPICPGTSPGLINLSGQTGAVTHWIYSTNQIIWSTIDSTTLSIPTQNLSQTTWFGAVVSLNNCPTDTSFIEIVTHITPLVNAGDDQTIDIGDSTSLDGETTELIYNWSPDYFINDLTDLSSTVIPQKDTIYILTAIDTNGCFFTDSVRIKVLTDWDYMTGVNIPNGFSPNNDGNNDLLDIFVGEDVKSFELVLIDRWGHVVFKTDSNDNLWDGTHNSKPVNTGVFAYTVVINLTNGSTEVVTGNVTVIR